jgi:hypothetical protein
MSMRSLIPTGWLMVVLGVALGAGGIAAGQALTGAVLLVSLVGSGAFMIWLAKGWDTPLKDSSELYTYGRPANAEVLVVKDPVLAADGTRTATVTLRVSPVNESAFKTTRPLALPGGNVPVVGERVTVKFDPNSRKNIVLMTENVQVKDRLHATADAHFGGLKA